MIPYPLNKIDAAVFHEICDQQTSESSTLDFKLTLPGKEDKDKEELAKDVSALLNADGGDLVYGIAEDRATGTAKTVVPLTIENFDKEERRILQVLDAWIEPRFHGIKLHQVPLEGGCGIVLRVPMSFDGPHWVRNPAGIYRRFVIRNGKMTSDMSFDQVRSAFTASASLAVQARDFIRSRLKLIEERKTQMPMDDGPIAVFELASLSGFAHSKFLDVKKVNYSDLIAWRYGGDPRMNLDGVGAYRTGKTGAMAQSQLFRNGSMEFMITAGGKSANGVTGLWATHTLDFFQQALKTSIQVAKMQNISGPVLITCAAMHVQGCVLDSGHLRLYGKASDRPFLILPEIFLEDISEDINLEDLLTDTRDVLYQSFGFQSAPL